MVAIKKLRILGFELEDGAFGEELFINFIIWLFSHFETNDNNVIMLNNCRYHHQNDVKKLVNFKNVNFCYLPAYSH